MNYQNTKLKIFFSAIIFFGLFGLAKSSEAATYWISPTGAAANLVACSGLIPLNGIAACSYDKAKGSGVVAGDTVYYRGGTYPTIVGALATAIEPYNSGTAGNPITFAAYPGEVVIFNGDVLTYGIYAPNKSYIRFTGYDGSTSARNMKFENFSNHVWLNNVDHIEVGHCSFNGSPRDLISKWQANHSYSIGDKVLSNASVTEYYFIVTAGGGNSGSTEPTWPDNNQTVVDGAVTWTAHPSISYRMFDMAINANYNWIHDNTLSNFGFYTPSLDGSTLFQIGWDDCGITNNHVCNDPCHNNVIENNIFFHGGHDTMGLNGYFNILRNNILHNEQWSQDFEGIWHSHRQMQMVTDATNGTTYNVVEGNTLSHGSVPRTPQVPGEAIDLLQNKVIIRYNNMFAQAPNAIYFASKPYGTANDVHIYNNTFFASGHGDTFPAYTSQTTPVNYTNVWPRSWYSRIPIGMTLTGYTPPAESTHGYFYLYKEDLYRFGDQRMRNVFKNNLFWKNWGYNCTGTNTPYSGCFGSTGLQMAYAGTNDDNRVVGPMFTGCTQGSNECPNTSIWGDTVIANNFNFTGNETDPKFVSEGDYASPSVTSRNIEWYWGATTPSGQDITTIKAQPSFTLQSDSPAIDIDPSNTKGYLTLSNGTGSNSTTLVVDDAAYFQPGWGKWTVGGPTVYPDEIAIGTVTNTVAIDSTTAKSVAGCTGSETPWVCCTSSGNGTCGIDYTNNTLFLTSAKTWSDNSPIWLYKKSDGVRVLYGEATDAGANEYQSGSSDTTPPAAPSGLSVN
jgi:hypothetical protein